MGSKSVDWMDWLLCLCKDEEPFMFCISWSTKPPRFLGGAGLTLVGGGAWHKDAGFIDISVLGVILENEGVRCRCICGP